MVSKEIDLFEANSYMEISLTNIVHKNGEFLVYFNSSLGKGVGRWASENKPLISLNYDVEFNINEELNWLDNINKAGSESTFIKIHKEKTIELQGKVESNENFEEDEELADNGNLCLMRLDNSLFIFSCANIPKDFLGYANITTSNLEIYDTNV